MLSKVARLFMSIMSIIAVFDHGNGCLWYTRNDRLKGLKGLKGLIGTKGTKRKGEWTRTQRVYDEIILSQTRSGETKEKR